MLLTMKAPANREKGQRIVRCNEAQADILRKIGWTEVEPPKFSEVRDQPTFYAEGSPPDQTLEPEPVTDSDEVRPKKRTYHRRTVRVEQDGKVNYSIKPAKRRYRRRDMTAEE